MTVDNELGVLDDGDVEATMRSHFDDIRGCYHRAGKAQRYAGGRVMLRFLVGGNGVAQDVLVIESTLGNYDVERCLVEVGRRITFHAPTGHKATSFEYPVEFRSTNQVAVLEVDGMKVDRDVSVFLPQLAACGQLAAMDANAIMYIEPNGFPGSVGLAAGTTLDEDVGGLHGADDPPLEDVGDAPRPRHARDVQHPAGDRDRRGDAAPPAAGHRRRR